MPRWGNPAGRPFGEYPFGGTLEDPADFGGITIATRMQAGWFFGTDQWNDGEFFRARITSATFL
jgi:hypothetical protein